MDFSLILIFIIGIIVIIIIIISVNAQEIVQKESDNLDALTNSEMETWTCTTLEVCKSITQYLQKCQL